MNTLKAEISIDVSDNPKLETLEDLNKIISEVKSDKRKAVLLFPESLLKEGGSDDKV